MKKTVMLIPIMILFANFSILLDIPILREVVVFIFLSFIPGFALLRLFRLRGISFLDSILFSAALSIVFVIFTGLLVNELFLFFGFSNPLSIIPLTVSISGFVLAFFFLEYIRDPLTLKQGISFEFEIKKNVLVLSIILFLLPLLSVLGVLYLNISLVFISYGIIVALCMLSVVSRKLIPEKLFPLMIFSISIALACQIPLYSKYITGWDANFEYFNFRITQINGHWGFLDANVGMTSQILSSMLSINLLPTVYSTLMHVQGEIVFKVLYPFIFSLVPLSLYRICEKQFGKLIGLLSALFFVFTYVAFYGAESVNLNRQIVGELFLVLSVFLLISKTIPLAKRRLLLIIFGAALAVSHYSVAYIYLFIITLFFIISRVKPKFNEAINSLTLLPIFLITFSWYSLGTSILTTLSNTIRATVEELLIGSVMNSGTASTMLYVRQTSALGTWINIFIWGIANLFLIVGIILLFWRPKRTGINSQFSLIILSSAVILFVSLIAPSVASKLNFTRFYGLSMLFLCPCFVLGGWILLATLGKVWTKIKRIPKRLNVSKSIDRVFLLIAIILSAYFLSQVGVVNHVLGGTLNYNNDFKRMNASSESQVKISLYSTYIPEQDVFSASWLLNHKVENANVFADFLSRFHVLVSYGLIPNQIIPMTNTTIPLQGSFVYLGSLNIINGVITTKYTESFNTSEISSLLVQNNLIYSNGNSEIWYVAPAH
jgi:uncharacterized membrane protein